MSAAKKVRAHLLFLELRPKTVLQQAGETSGNLAVPVRFCTMAIYHLEIRPVSRSGARSVVAAAAYRTGDVLQNPRDGVIHDYHVRAGITSEILGWSASRQDLWGQTEMVETRKNARLAVEAVVALPSELSPQQRLVLAHEFASEVSLEYGVPVDLAVHSPDRNGDHRNFHAHMLVGCRVVSDGLTLGARIVPFDGADQVRAWRERWADRTNAALEAHGSTVRIDHRSHVDQGSSLTPTVHMGVAATAMERDGKGTEIGDHNRRIVAHNAPLRARQESTKAAAAACRAAAATFEAEAAAHEASAHIDDARAADAARLDGARKRIGLGPRGRGRLPPHLRDFGLDAAADAGIDLGRPISARAPSPETAPARSTTAHSAAHRRPASPHPRPLRTRRTHPSDLEPGAADTLTAAPAIATRMINATTVVTPSPALLMEAATVAARATWGAGPGDAANAELRWQRLHEDEAGSPVRRVIDLLRASGVEIQPRVVGDQLVARVPYQTLGQLLSAPTADRIGPADRIRMAGTASIRALARASEAGAVPAAQSVQTPRDIAVRSGTSQASHEMSPRDKALAALAQPRSSRPLGKPAEIVARHAAPASRAASPASIQAATPPLAAQSDGMPMPRDTAARGSASPAPRETLARDLAAEMLTRPRAPRPLSGLADIAAQRAAHAGQTDTPPPAARSDGASMPPRDRTAAMDVLLDPVRGSSPTVHVDSTGSAKVGPASQRDGRMPPGRATPPGDIPGQPIGAARAEALLRDGVIHVGADGVATIHTTRDRWHGSGLRDDDPIWGLGPDLAKIGLKPKIDRGNVGSWISVRLVVAELAEALGRLTREALDPWLARLECVQKASADNRVRAKVALDAMRRAARGRDGPGL